MAKKDRDFRSEKTGAEKSARQRGYGEGFRDGAKAAAAKIREAEELKRAGDDI